MTHSVGDRGSFRPQAGSIPTEQAVRSAAKALTPKQRGFVKAGCIHGDFTMRTVYALRDKGLFHLVIDSPNGRCGFMRLTPLGEAVQAAIQSATGEG